MIGYIYLTTNELNGICYIGKRQKPFFDRAYKGSGTHLKLALNKYGRDKFHSECCKGERKTAYGYKWEVV